jgi:hypothetical protein
MFNVACQAWTKAQQRKNAPAAYCCTTDAKPLVACRFAFAFCLAKTVQRTVCPVLKLKKNVKQKMGQALLVVVRLPVHKFNCIQLLIVLPSAQKQNGRERLRLGDVAVFENRQLVTAAKFITKSSLFILLLGIIRRLELKLNSEQKVENMFVAPPYCQTDCCTFAFCHPTKSEC